LREKYPIPGHPAVLFIDNTGKETDRIIGYSPPPEDFITRLKKNVISEN